MPESRHPAVGSFIFEVLQQRAQLADVDDWVDRWHSQRVETPGPLHRYLGLTWKEYQGFVADPDVITFYAYRYAKVVDVLDGASGESLSPRCLLCGWIGEENYSVESYGLEGADAFAQADLEAHICI